MENKFYPFPTDFWWGSASSATQMEGASTQGGKGENIWDYWFQEEPNRFFNGVGPGNTSNFYEQYKEDISLMKELGHNSFRLSISWSRLIPTGDGEVNEEAVTFYKNVLNEMISQDVEPFVNLYHFDMPMAMQRIGGWESREVVQAYVRYASICFELFGDLASKWFTHNEPVVPVEQQYLYGNHYPAECDFKKAVQAGFHSVLAGAKAVKVFKEKGYKGEIGVILNLTPSYPRSNHPEDLKAGNMADLFFNRSFLDPFVKGEFPSELVDVLKTEGFMPEIQEGDLDIIANNTVDLLGVNYYQPRRVKAKENMPNPNAPFLPERYFDHYEMPGRKMNPYRGWEIYEKGIYDILVNVKENYGNIPCFISENGMGVENEDRFLNSEGQVQDDYRIEFYKNHLKWMHKAIEEGANLKGYHVWTFIDNWSWLNAYKNRYGLISLDLDNGFKRTIKKSGEWYKELSIQNGFYDGESVK
ncbi:glycoside hydrolase family 1 protein [Lederbergia lenta]|uniref:Mannoside-phospho-beta-d-glucosidase n=1 Tax=Lederbergia lenta TaxID=1467 RepID=A0A2X4WQZ9_LEDLE|nr:glycoside hydrolase family 1 protein [Lederbergia lenta]MEC2322933.1 glycoside hydrolase family 1 protein [Lederbergia lenta]SQI62068.1 mannoside-phospho-beta-d-glucosidase [Lederbergia lenta]